MLSRNVPRSSENRGNERSRRGEIARHSSVRLKSCARRNASASVRRGMAEVEVAGVSLNIHRSSFVIITDDHALQMMIALIKTEIGIGTVDGMAGTTETTETTGIAETTGTDGRLLQMTGVMVPTRVFPLVPVRTGKDQERQDQALHPLQCLPLPSPPALQPTAPPTPPSHPPRPTHMCRQ